MPNWCSNQVCITGSKEDVAAFRALVRGGSQDENTFSFQEILPCPKELHEPIPFTDISTEQRTALEWERFNKYGCVDWYDWQVCNWGSKWDASDVFLDYFDEESASWEFSTPWCPPNGIYEELVRRFPNVSISWFFNEPGMQVAGYLNNPNNGGW